MRNVIIPYLFILIGFTFARCEKDNIVIEKEELFQSVDIKEKALNEALGSAPEGWVMMVKGTASEQAYFPIVMRFDTAKNTVRMRAPFGTQMHDVSTYLINRGTSGVILNFSGGSVVSGLMRKGSQYADITDYQFNVIKATSDTITIQGVRSGAAYKPEGGVVYKMFKKPEGWTWADDELKIDFRRQEDVPIANRYARLNLKNHQTNDSLFFIVRFVLNYNQDSWKVVDPFFTDPSSRVFDPYFIFSMNVYEAASSSATSGVLTTYAPFQVHNGFAIFSFAGNATTITTNPTFNTKYKFNHLLYNKVTRVGDNVVIDVVAYDKQGKELVTGQYHYQYP